HRLSADTAISVVKNARGDIFDAKTQSEQPGAMKTTRIRGHIFLRNSLDLAQKVAVALGNVHRGGFRRTL
ncbi:MAG: hypothetical protein ACO32G_00720, partial [Pontimonas sp.]